MAGGGQQKEARVAVRIYTLAKDLKLDSKELDAAAKGTAAARGACLRAAATAVGTGRASAELMTRAS